MERRVQADHPFEPGGRHQHHRHRNGAGRGVRRPTHPGVRFCNRLLRRHRCPADRRERAARAGFLAGVVRDWEAAASPAIDAGVRVAFARTGLVVSSEGGAWQKLFPIFKAGIGGKLGSGDQYWSAISLTDEVRALCWLIDNEISGPVNLVGPDPLTNVEVTRSWATCSSGPR